MWVIRARGNVIFIHELRWLKRFVVPHSLFLILPVISYALGAGVCLLLVIKQNAVVHVHPVDTLMVALLCIHLLVQCCHRGMDCADLISDISKEGCIDFLACSFEFLHQISGEVFDGAFAFLLHCIGDHIV